MQKKIGEKSGKLTLIDFYQFSTSQPLAKTSGLLNRMIKLVRMMMMMKMKRKKMTKRTKSCNNSKRQVKKTERERETK